MKHIITLTFFIFIFFINPMFGQKLLWQSVKKKEKFKYEYCFSINEKKDTISVDKNLEKTIGNLDTIYQINSKKELSLDELNLIMKCVKKTEDKNGNTHPFNCNDPEKYYISIQI